MATDISVLVTEQREKFLSVRSDNSILFEKEASFALQVLNANSYLRTTAMNNQASLQAAIVNVAAIGISLNPATKLAYLVPRDSKVCLDISYVGLMHIAQQCGAIKWGQAIVVRQNDDFALSGIDEPPHHKFNPFDGAEKRGAIIGAYCVVKTDSGDFLTNAMPIEQINKIRDRSAAYKTYVKDNSKTCPWVTDAEEMIKKTVVKNGFKYWPSRERLANTIEYMNTQSGEGLDLEPEKEVLNLISDEDCKYIRDGLSFAGISEESFCSIVEIDAIESLAIANLERAKVWINKQIAAKEKKGDSK